MLEMMVSGKSFIKEELEIMNSQPKYNILSDGKPQLDMKDILTEHEDDEVEKERYLLKWKGKHIGIIDFTMYNPKDGFPWLGLLLIHKSFEGQGLAKEAYQHYEKLMTNRRVSAVRLGCYKDNNRGLDFWGRLGFRKIKEVQYKEKPLLVMEKELK
ncbi:GNAT family N-acetyltransferase [Sutcliffiella sp. NPDC057660]|uniref:GNAT family N-acetyltransferase n=1 Tax=Sutcliffiella sp. NPDC057660 TaxID=3346199 RepID=UPI003693B337